MDEAQSAFLELIARVRAGEESAITQLVRENESAIRRAIRFRLTDPHLRNQTGSEDVAQSVLKSFFVRVALGEYALTSPDDLASLLATMVRNKIADMARHHRAMRRDARRNTGIDGLDVAASGPGPAEIFDAKELMAEFVRRLKSPHGQVVEGRAKEMTYEEIARDLGGNITGEGLRKAYLRDIERVANELGIDLGDTDE